MALLWLAFSLVASGTMEEFVAFRPLGVKLFAMIATATDVPSLSMSDVSADTHFLMPVWVTATLGDPRYNSLYAFAMVSIHF